MAVQALFFVQSVKQTAGNPEAREVTMSAVVRGDHAKEWARYTPSASLTMFVDNPAAVAQFPVGQEFLVTFQPADKGVVQQRD